jgi:hypothetical protein
VKSYICDLWLLSFLTITASSIVRRSYALSEVIEHWCRFLCHLFINPDDNDFDLTWIWHTICVGHQYAQTNTHNVNKNCPYPLQTTRGKDEPNIVSMRKSSRTSQHGTQIIKTPRLFKILDKVVHWTTIYPVDS